MKTAGAATANSAADLPVLSFVWPYTPLANTGVSATLAAECGAIIDFTRDSSASLAALPDAADVMLDEGQLTQDADTTSLNGKRRFWVICTAVADERERTALVERLTALAIRTPCIPIVTDPLLVEPLLRHFPALALKGHEAEGFVSTESAHVLLSAARRAARRTGTQPRLVIWGGIATPEAAAAYLATGADAIVFESVHWLTDGLECSAAHRSARRSLRPDHTRVVAQDLGLPCRLFDKGNSTAVRDLISRARALATAQSPDAARAFLRACIRSAPARYEARCDRDEILPLGPEAAFASAFVERFGGGTQDALTAFTAAVRAEQDAAADRLRGFTASGRRPSWGSRLPIVQGAMSWITDQPAFARAVADAGGLPAIALGMRSRAELARDLEDLRARMGDLPYALNVMVLDENPRREEQLAWIETTRPPLVVIAAGHPSYARRLTEKGIGVLYIASDEGLLRVARETGISRVILEGNEAGGHVGPHTLTTLAQTVIEQRRQNPGAFAGLELILAGGIFDRESAARAVLLGADAVQIGTAYLSTEEIVATGALSRVYQQKVVEAQPGDTLVMGEALGLRIRSLRSPKTAQIAQIEARIDADAADEGSLRRELEAQAAGTLLIAAHAVASPGGAALDEATCRREGQFMSGAVAGCIDRVVSVAALHEELAQLATLATQTTVQAPAVRTRPRAVSPARRERIAITGIAIANA
ncbi:MAG: nitronate monooxygenase, partial [Vicinamibacteria bacterium]|nr:nitronate monooxygenase [Vicinamibacteria bacterium]